jgi:hypothetical protein
MIKSEISFTYDQIKEIDDLTNPEQFYQGDLAKIDKSISFDTLKETRPDIAYCIRIRAILGLSNSY